MKRLEKIILNHERLVPLSRQNSPFLNVFWIKNATIVVMMPKRNGLVAPDDLVNNVKSSI